MPIRADQKWFYPIDWRELSRVIRFDRAKGRCERCDRPHGHRVVRDADGHWWDDVRQRWRDGRGRTLRTLPDPTRLVAALPLLSGFETLPLPRSLVVLATAHLDHDPGNNAPRNLAALCQRCHLAHDRRAHRRQRWATMFYRRALGDLFTGVYSSNQLGSR